MQMDLANRGLTRLWPYTYLKLPSQKDSVYEDIVFGYIRSNLSQEIGVLTNLIINFCIQKGLYIAKIFYETRVEYSKEGSVLRAMLSILQQEDCIVKNVVIPEIQCYSSEDQQLVNSLNVSFNAMLITRFQLDN